MIGIAIGMFASIYFPGKIIMILRITLNAYYLVWMIIIPLTSGFTKANPHTIYFGYYLNLIVPLIYIFASSYSYLSDRT